MKKAKESINTYFEERENGYEKIPSGMLSSPHIKYCIKEYKIITSTDETQEELLKNVTSAIYKMRLGYKAWGYNNQLEPFSIDFEKKNKVELPPNSLTFLSTLEEFNLPKDIIVRFNLRVKLVHQGLLLGTGPIVDPEFCGRLLIPVHNFSSKTVTLNYKDDFINLEFTKTLDPDTKFIIGEDELKYVPNKHRVFDLDKYANDLDNLSQSSILEQLNKLKEKLNTEQDTYKKSLENLEKRSRTSNRIVNIGTALATITLILTAFAMYSSFSGIVAQAQKDISNFNALLRVEENSENTINTKQFVLRHEYDELNEKYNRLIKELELLKHKRKKNDQEAQQSH